MSLSISTSLLASDLPTTHTLSQAHSFVSSTSLRQFELDEPFRDSFSVLRRHQARIQGFNPHRFRSFRFWFHRSELCVLIFLSPT